MNWKTIPCILILLPVFIKPVSAQSRADIESMRKVFKPVEIKTDYSLKLDPTNEFKLILSSGFAFYKTFVSSQDVMKCTFYPSCSVYAYETVKTNGLLGVLDAIDRLTRCNGISPEKYHIHESTQRYYDPVRKIRH